MKSVFLLAAADLKKFIKSPKAFLILMFTFFFVYDFAEKIRVYAISENVGVTPYVYPVFLSDWSGCLYIILLMVVLMSDAPFYNGSELFIKLRIDKYKWLFGKIIYIFTISIIYQIIIILMTILVFVPDIGISSEWGYAIKAYYTGIGGGINASGEEVTNILLNYKPVEAMLAELMLAFEISVMLGILILIINGIFKNYTGTIIIGILSCLHLFIKDFDFFSVDTGASDKVPVSWINLSDFKEGFTPHEACGILFIIIAVLVMLCMMLVKKGKIQVYK